MSQDKGSKVISTSYMTGLIVKCGLLFTAGIVATGIILYLSSHQPLGPTYQESFARLAQLKHEMLTKSIVIYCVLTAVIMAGVVCISILYSHRVVGPLVGLRRVIAAINKGDLTTRAVLREKDAITPMADAINDMLNQYRNRVNRLDEAVAEVKTALTAPDSRARLQEAAGRLRAIMDELKL